MEAERLLETLCRLRRVCYVGLSTDWHIRTMGGMTDPWPELAIGVDLRVAIPELQARLDEAGGELPIEEGFALRWVRRTGAGGRNRFYEFVVHPDDGGEGRICWLIDRSAYGRLKVRIDRYYRELVDGNLPEPPTDPFSGAVTEPDPTV